MNLNTISKSLEKLFNTAGNRYLTKKYDIEPFEFKVKTEYRIYQGEPYVYILVNTDRPFPETLINKNKDSVIKVSRSVVRQEFKKYLEYVSPSFYKLWGNSAGIIFTNTIDGIGL